MMNPSYLIVLFDEAKEPVPSNAQWKYVEKKRWQSMQGDMIKGVEIAGDHFEIVNRRSFQMGDLTGKTMVLILDIQKINA